MPLKITSKGFFYLSGDKIFQYCTCPAGRVTYNFHSCTCPIIVYAIKKIREYEGRFFYVRREVDLMKTAKVNAYIMHIFGKIELLSIHATLNYLKKTTTLL